ncbi:hypothetical protein SPHFLASMR4Y_01730 [Sphingorhabdus sp. SMR4y]|nr:hypothetical protein SPHFLASMR4Y_01730 [Sphingorhabdus sp. SMR4y]
MTPIFTTNTEIFALGFSFAPGGFMILIGPFACGLFWEDE